MEGVHFLCTIPVVIIFMLVYHREPSLIWFWGIPLIAISQIFLSFGFALLFSTLNLFFRDLERFVSLAILLLFYCTPILYSADMIPVKYKWVIAYNPLSGMIASWRDLSMNHTLNYEAILRLYVSAGLVLVLGVLVFTKLKFRFAEIL